MHTSRVEYEWDPDKAQTNLRRHGVDFADAVFAIEDDQAMTMEDPDSIGEQRFVTVGVDALGRLLIVVYTWRDETIRLISARQATRSERRRYEE